MAGVYRIYPGKNKGFFSGLSITSWIVFANVLVFFTFLITLLVYKGNPETLYNFLALKPLNILQGKYLWTFLTSMFMHGGLFHIFANMFSLIFVGSLVEKILGRKRYLWFYLVSGLFAGLFFVLSAFVFKSDLNAFAVGASGALFGVVGLLMFLTPNLKVYVMFIPIPIKLKYAAPGILVLLWLISITANIGIGNTAHLGGLIAGIVYGVYLRLNFPNKTKAIRKHFS